MLSTVSVASVFSEDTVSEVFAVSVAAVLLPHPATIPVASANVVSNAIVLFFIMLSLL